MPVVEVMCPACGEALKVPREHLGKKGRCYTCKAVFPIVEAVGKPADQTMVMQSATSEQDVLGWLDDGEETTRQQRSAGPETAVAAGDDQARRTSPKPKAATQPSAPKRFTLRLGHVDEMGAFLLFEPELLYSEDFRSGFPQQCVVCGKRRHLSIHLVLWSSKLPGRGEFGAHTSYSRSVFELDKLGRLTGHDLLAVLGRLENLPEPYCLPFPYYLCQDCSPIGAIVPDVRFAPDGQGQECELGIFSLKQAAEFVRATCGPDCPALKQILEALQQSRRDPWQALPLAVRSRIKQWFIPQPGEKFAIYIPDGDFAKTEAGLAGIVVTDKRLVYRKFASKVEIPLAERITIEPKSKDGRRQLHISWRSGKPAVLVVDETTSERLRASLGQHGAKATWLAAQE